ncbi:phosphotransferase-like protein [endosymbiont GvMRE of Glomus versiforme]
MKNKIIFLNGPSSTGKSSLVKAIQHYQRTMINFWCWCFFCCHAC